MLESIGRKLARKLSSQRGKFIQVATSAPEKLAETLHPGDVLLIDGNSVFSKAIKYLTQSNWSHAALYVGDVAMPGNAQGKGHNLVEADINDGVRCIDLSYYDAYHTRICRPVGLSPDEVGAVIDFAMSRLGHQYDLRNIFDLARYLLPKPSLPLRYRRKLLALGSGDPTQAICSSLIAEAFQSVKYPILPENVVKKSKNPACIECYQEMLQIRHHSLFTPRDFDLSPYFQIVKPNLAFGFDFHSLDWSER